MSKTKYKDVIVEFYNRFMRDFSDETYEAVGWVSNRSQEERFKILTYLGIDENTTVLDFGCGLGHFVDFMKKRGIFNDNYRGIDINPKAIQIARERNPDALFEEAEIFDITNSYDYVIGSGVFTVKMSQDEVDEAIAHAFSICRVGVAFNFLTKDYADIEHFNTYVPIEFYQRIKNTYKKVGLAEGYLENEDFTIFIYK